MKSMPPQTAANIQKEINVVTIKRMILPLRESLRNCSDNSTKSTGEVTKEIRPIIVVAVLYDQILKIAVESGYMMIDVMIPEIGQITNMARSTFFQVITFSFFSEVSRVWLGVEGF